MKKILQVLIPPLLGIIVLVSLMELEEVFNRQEISDSPKEVNQIFYWNIFIPALIFILVIIQAIFILPVKNKLDQSSRNTLKSYLMFILILSLIIGGVVGLVLWSPKFGITDLFFTLSIGVIVQVLYWTINFLSLNLLDKWLE